MAGLYESTRPSSLAKGWEARRGPDRGNAVFNVLAM